MSEMFEPGEQRVNDVAKVYARYIFKRALRPAAIVLGLIMLAAVRLGLAIFGLTTITNSYIVWGCVGAYLAVKVFFVANFIRFRRKHPHPKPQQSAGAERPDSSEFWDNLGILKHEVFEVKRPLKARLRFVTRLPVPLGLSILAGAGIWHVAGPVWGIVTAAVLFLPSALSPFALLREFKGLIKTISFLRPVPRDTPEI